MASGRTNKHKPQETVKAGKQPRATGDPTDVKKPSADKISRSSVVEEHLPPLSLVFFVFVLSGPLFVLGLRDMLATGKVVAGTFDGAMQVRLAATLSLISCIQLFPTKTQTL